MFLATPTTSGLEPGYTFALFTSSQALADAGIACELAIYAGDCHVDDARNRLVRDFLETDCTDLVFIDSDVGWEPKDLVSLCRFDRDVVAATYPFKQDERGFPVRLMPGLNNADGDGLLEAESVPTGFLRIRRAVLERLAGDAQKFRPKSDRRSMIPLIFERTIDDGARWGGDYTFCRKWRATGGRIWLMPEARMDHTGAHTWSGSFGHFKRVENGDAIAAGLAEIAAGIETDETFNDIVAAWDNPWSVGPDFLIAAVALARGAQGPILECGSGLTTLAMVAAGGDVWSLESDAEWADKVLDRVTGLGRIHLHTAPLVDGWYDLPDNLPTDFSVAVVDGPPRQNGERFRFWPMVGERVRYAHWIVDDCDDPTIGRTFAAQCDNAGRRHVVLGRDPKRRQFGVSPAPTLPVALAGAA